MARAKRSSLPTLETGAAVAAVECGAHGAAAENDPRVRRIGNLTVEQTVARVAAEWVQRIGASRAAGPKTAALVRAVLLSALDEAESYGAPAVSAAVVEEFRTLHEAGWRAQRIFGALYQLSAAFWEVLRTSGEPLDSAAAIMERLNDGLFQILDATVRRWEVRGERSLAEPSSGRRWSDSVEPRAPGSRTETATLHGRLRMVLM